MRLESGPAINDMRYFSIVAVVCVALAGWFYYDGAVGYISQNREEAHRELVKIMGVDGAPAEDAELGEAPTKKDFEALQQRATDAGGYLTMDQVTETLAEPIHQRKDATGEFAYYASDYGLATLQVSPGRRVRATDLTWRKWHKSKPEVMQQFYWAIVPLAFGIYFGFRAFSAATLRVRIDDQALHYGRQRITFDQMNALRDYSAKGWVDLYYATGSGEKKLRIDDHKVKRFHEIIDVLCEAKGFDDPRRSVAGGDARSEAGGDDQGDAQVE